MSKKYDVVYGRRWTDKSGAEKTHWINCGAIIKTEKGYSLKLETIPVGFDGWFALFEPKPKDEPAQKSGFRDSPPPDDDFGDSIPF